MPFWKKKPKRQTTAKPKTNTASPKETPKQEPKPKPKPTPPPPRSKPEIPKKSTKDKKGSQAGCEKRISQSIQATYLPA